MHTIFKGLKAEEFQHPFDLKALTALKNIVGMEKIFSIFLQYNFVKMQEVMLKGSGFHITQKSFPRLYKIHKQCLHSLDIKEEVELYIQQSPVLNAYTVGGKTNIIAIHSSLVELLSDEELAFVLGHEAGHIKCQHVLYHTMGRFLESILEIISNASLGVGGIATMPIRYAFSHWSRMSEYSADRAGLLACQNPDAVSKVMLRFSGVTESINQDFDSCVTEFVQQAKAMEDLNNDLASAIHKVLMNFNLDHPWSVYRCKEMLEWAHSEAYSNFIDNYYHHSLNTSPKTFTCARCGAAISTKECPKCFSRTSRFKLG